MAERKTKNIKADKEFIENILDKIREQERERGGNDKYPTATRILYKRILKAGGLKQD